jgi:hypothetical protein
VTEARLREEKPDIVLILRWNLKEEIMEQLSYAREWATSDRWSVWWC